MMGKSDLLIVLGASFSNHTGISIKKKTIQVDIDRMTLGKFHPVTVPLWGEIRATLKLFCDGLDNVDRSAVREDIAKYKHFWRNQKEHDAGLVDVQGRMHPALVFEHLTTLVPADAVICVDVGNNTYSFGRYFECSARMYSCQAILVALALRCPRLWGPGPRSAVCAR